MSTKDNAKCLNPSIINNNIIQFNSISVFVKYLKFITKLIFYNNLAI